MLGGGTKLCGGHNCVEHESKTSAQEDLIAPKGITTAQGRGRSQDVEHQETSEASSNQAPDELETRAEKRPYRAEDAVSHQRNRESV